MQKSHLLTLAGVAVLMTSSTLFAQVTVKEEGVQTTFTVGPEASSSFNVSAAFACPGGEACQPAVVRVVFTAVGQPMGRPQYAENHSVSLILNEGTTLSVPNPRYRAQKGVGKQMYEIIVCMVPTEDFLTLAKAEKAEARIGPHEANLTKKQLSALSALGEAITDTQEPLGRVSKGDSR
jgi:hypothetical protein